MKLPTLFLPPIHRDTLRATLCLSLSGEKMSRREWAEQTHTSLTTAGKIAKALLDAELITEQAQKGFQSGRKTGLLRTNRACRFLVVSVDRSGCRFTVSDGWGERLEETWLPYQEDLTRQENMLIWRAEAGRWKEYLEHSCFLVGSALTVSEKDAADHAMRESFAAWETDCLILREQGVRDMILGRFGSEAVYFVSLESDLHPILYVKGRELAGNPILAKDHPRRPEQLRCMIERWNAMKQIVPDPRLILWAKNVSPAEDEILRQKLLSGGTERILYSHDLEIESALYCLRSNMAESIVCDKQR